jgi:pyruvate kinase
MRVKIVATLGPASMDRAVMKAMVEHGVRIFRLNFSHSDAAFFAPVVKLIREVEAEVGVPITVMGDLCGPKIRIGEVAGSPLTIHKGCAVTLGPSQMRDLAEGCAFIALDKPELLRGLDSGMRVALSDGMLQFVVTRVVEKDTLYVMEAQNSGILTSNKGIAFPGKHLAVAAVTDKDRRDLHGGLDIGMDAVALSFVQTPEDVLDLRKEIEAHGTWIPIVAKIETQHAVERLADILEVSDAIMVARGDLGVEMPLSELPIIQKKAIRAARHAQKAVIVATQMLLSMVKNPVPTRAEATDVANAILDGADCVMLSEETAVGVYPVETVRTMQGIAENAEGYLLERQGGPFKPSEAQNIVKYLAYSACILADHIGAKAIVCHSTSGSTGRQISSRRPSQAIYSLTNDERVLRALNFCWGVKPRLTYPDLPRHLDRVEKFVRDCPELDPGEPVILTAGQPTPGQKSQHTNELKIYYK